MEINNNKLNSLPQQVEENMKNIKLLAQYLKEAYKTSLTLSDSDVSIAISDTNATTDTKDGWLLDSIGNLFKINGGDGTNLLIEFYTSFRGEKGDTGDTGATGATGADGARGYSLHYASVSFDSNVSIYDITNISSNTPIVKDDVVLFKNGYLAIITNVTEYHIYVNLLNYVQLEISGKQQYQHNIIFDINSPATLCNPILEIINDISTPMTIIDIKDYLTAKGYTSIKSAKRFTGYDYTGSKPIYNIYNDNGTLHYWGTDSGGPRNATLSDATTINDVIEPL